MVTFDILNNISKYVILVKLVDSLGKMNHAVSVVGKWLFDSNYENFLPLTFESMNLICACSDEDEYFAIFLELFYVVMCVNPKEKLQHVQKSLDIVMNIYSYVTV